MTDPLISVLAIAYDRREYIDRALKSAIDQSLSRELYEIILLTNFDVGNDLVEEYGIRVVHSNIRELGPKLAEVIPLLHGNIICFLEDDDEWLPDKLRHTLEVFFRDPRVGYYHNNWTVIDEQDAPLKHPIHQLGRRKIESVKELTVDPNHISYDEVRKFVHLGGDFNGSSISVRKAIAVDNIDYLRRILFSPDTFFFYSALTSDFLLFMDSNVLTRYRIHHKNISRRESSEGDVQTDPTHLIIIEMLENKERNLAAKKSMECQMSDIKIESYWIWDIGDRRRLAWLLFHHLRYFTRSEFSYNILLFSFGILYLLNPKIAYLVYSKNYYGV